MHEQYLYRQIAGSLRQDILRGRLHPGDRLPGIREMTVQWGCTQGTVQKAYQDLVQQGLVVSRPGQGTHVAAGALPRADAPLRIAGLVHRAESFLLEVLTAGFTPAEAEQAVRLALDRWRTLADTPPEYAQSELRFVGSHDPAVALLAARASEIAPGFMLHVSFTGSLGGLMALARGEAAIAGSHLWDEETDTYNAPFVRRLLPGRRIALLTLAHRSLGLLSRPDDARPLAALSDLTEPKVRFVNRQRGSGTRVWLDAQLRRHGIDTTRVVGYGDEVSTHGEAAMVVAEGRADVGLAVQAAAIAYGLRFAALTQERYDLVVPAEIWDTPGIQSLWQWLRGASAIAAIDALGGYDTTHIGEVEWVE